MDSSGNLYSKEKSWHNFDFWKLFFPKTIVFFFFLFGFAHFSSSDFVTVFGLIYFFSGFVSYQMGTGGWLVFWFSSCHYQHCSICLQLPLQKISLSLACSSSLSWSLSKLLKHNFEMQHCPHVHVQEHLQTWTWPPMSSSESNCLCKNII